MEEVNIRSRFCPCCKVSQEIDDPSHIGSPLHQFNLLLWRWNRDRKSLVRNRHGIEVTISQRGRPLIHDVNNGKHFFKITPDALLNQENNIDFKCTVTNRRRGSVYITYANVLMRYTWFSFHDANNTNTGARIEVAPGNSHSVVVKFTSGESGLLGTYSIPICFSIKTIGQTPDKFDIVRSINISIMETIREIVDVTESPFKGNPWPKEVAILPPTCYVNYTNLYPIPDEYKKFFMNDLVEFYPMRREDWAALTELRLRLEPGNVTINNYQKFWHTVLWLEETNQALGLQQYNMENVAIRLKGNDEVEITVPGLAEKRPSVIKGDMVDIRIHDDHTGYRGMIKAVNDNTIIVGNLDEECLCIIESSPETSEDMDVKFVLSRLSFERQHQGVSWVARNNLLECLFPPDRPRQRNMNTFRTINDGEFFNKSIVTNQEQKMAVSKILNATSNPYPYIVFGPPGTGKTVTIVEAILQIKNKTKHHILVCAPSNAACDVITEKLQRHCDKNELLRILSENVDVSNIHEIILPYTNYEGNGFFRKINAENLSEYRIIVTTLILAGRFTGRYRPDVVFIDEAAQASEPEACCAIGLMDKGKRIVLAGDPKQLGPSLSSDTAKNYGLGISLLERLMEFDIYAGNDSNYTTMLVQNFRNHSKILQLPNGLFYNNQLQAMSARAELDPISNVFIYSKIQEFPTKKNNRKQKQLKGQPIEFCSLISEESREGRSPSYYNTVELQMVLKYIQALLDLEFEDEADLVLQTDIGVVTPYVRQVHKMKGLLQQHGLAAVEVGTTETFQGREKRIIIISTVRAKENLLLEDKKYKLGFVNNEKRFNVALTRAMSKLVVIGCAHVLATDDKWLQYIELCESLNGFCGAPFSRKNDDVITEVTRRLGNINRDTQFNHHN